MRTSRRVLGAAMLLAVLATAPAGAHPAARSTSDTTATSTATSVPVPVLASPNVSLVSSFPETQAISGEFAHTGPYFYVSSLDSISVFDISDPRRPRLTGTLGNLVFENEAMTYGERKVDGRLERFLLVGNDLYNATFDRSSGPSRGRPLGKEVLVIDVTDPANPRLRSRTPALGSQEGAVKTSTHTVQCLTLSCEYAYTAGSSSRFSVIDLRDLDRPRDVAQPPSPAAGPNDVFASGSGHYWDVDDAGIAWHTGSGGAAAFDVSDPLGPRLLNTTNAQGVQSPWNDFIHHNSARPNAAAFVAGSGPSLANGNVLLVTEEDYLHDGDEVACDKAGTFQSWHVPQTAGAGTIEPLDLINPVVAGDGLSTPVGGFCSAHWFDVHAQTGIVAQGYYQQGLRFIDPRDPRDLKQYGYFTTGASEVWDAYWVPQRNRNGVRQDKDTNLVYSVDLARGLDVVEVSLPGA